MASLIRNGLLSAARRLSNPSKIIFQTPKVALGASNSRLFSTKLTGSVWKLSNNNSLASKARVSHLPNLHCNCGCRSYSESDEEFANVLEDEITLESEKIIDLPKIENFEVISQGGSEFELERKEGNQTITIKVNVNAAAESVGPPEEEGEDEEMICRPDFEINIEKEGNEGVLSFFCMYDKSDDLDEESDLFIIHSISVYTEDAEDRTYTLQAENLDPDMYRIFFDYLSDRKIDNNFAYDLTDFATVYEHKKYVELLESVKDFVKPVPMKKKK